MFNVVFFSKKDALHRIKKQILFFIMFVYGQQAFNNTVSLFYIPWFEFCLNRNLAVFSGD